MNKCVLGAARALHRHCKLALMGAALAAASSVANAQTLSIDPASQTTGIGSEISIAITASDLRPGGLGSYSLDLSFEGSVLSFDRVVDGMGMGGTAFGLFYALSGNVLTLTDTSLDDVDTLLASQSPSFALFTVYFDAVGEGTSALSLSGVTLADAHGMEMGYAANEASVTVLGTVTPVPEPATWSLLLAGGLAGLALRRKPAHV